jgi:hypothetical protein
MSAQLKSTIELFKEQQLKVYSIDPKRLKRDSQSAQRAAGDHVGRWLYELVQNCDDAHAKRIHIQVTSEAIYVADDGNGLCPNAVFSISGTDYSDKESGTIGRKGIGFKAVYSISKNPQIFTRREGLEFNEQRASQWLADNKLQNSYVPYQWIPFFIDRATEEQKDSILSSLEKYTTVIKLPLIVSVEAVKNDLQWPSYCLLPFHSLQEIEICSEQITYSIRKEKKDLRGTLWVIHDSRTNEPEFWAVSQSQMIPPQEVIATLSKEEQDRIYKDKVEFLVASRVEKDIPIPSEYDTIYVFYPTHDKAPVPLLLHAEFQVKSDRTEISPSIESGLYNCWVSNQLAELIGQHVSRQYCPKEPVAYLRLLSPISDLSSHETAKSLWGKIKSYVRDNLLFPDENGSAVLRFTDAILISTKSKELARKILSGLSLRQYLLHPATDEDTQIRKTLQQLGCKEIKDKELIELIGQYASEKSSDQEWLTTCWLWLAEWLAEIPYDCEEKRKRIEILRTLPILPISKNLKNANELAGKKIISGEPEGNNIPNWLPLVFVDRWFGEFLQENDTDVLSAMSKALGLSKFTEEVLVDSVAKAIEQYWEQQDIKPSNFLRFLMEQDWEETPDFREKLGRCPVLAKKEGTHKKRWVPVNETYFGKDWGNNYLSILYKGCQDVLWIYPIYKGNKREKEEKLYRRLGCAFYPRIIRREGFSRRETPAEYKRWVEKCWNGSNITKVKEYQIIDHLDNKELDREKSFALIYFLSQYWSEYYSKHTEDSGFKRRNEWPTRITSQWWYFVQEELQFALGTSSCETHRLSEWFLPDEDNEMLRGLLAIIDIEQFKDKSLCVGWLRETCKVRERLKDIKEDEWSQIFSAIREKLSGEQLEDEKTRLKIKKVYEICLETIEKYHSDWDSILAMCPVLCRQEKTWFFSDDRERLFYLDNDFYDIFVSHFSLFEMPRKYQASIKNYLEIRPISKEVCERLEDYHVCECDSYLQKKLEEIQPFLYAMRCIQSKDPHEGIRREINEINFLVVDRISVVLKLKDVEAKKERPYYILKTDEQNRKKILIARDNTQEMYLSQAVAEYLGILSEADFIENLIRCRTREERIAKLSTKGEGKKEIENYLQEYEGTFADLMKSPFGESGDNSLTKPQTNMGLVSTSIETEKPDSGEVAAARSGDYAETRNRLENHSLETLPSESRKEENKVLSRESWSVGLKDANEADYEIVKEHRTSKIGGGGGVGGASVIDEGELSAEEKSRIEEAGRALAMRVLQEKGFQVEQKPFDYPGHDIEASKGGRTLYIEVKAHKNISSYADISLPQFEEYCRYNKNTDDSHIRWQLWNIENLSENANGKIRLRIIENLPDECLNIKGFKVDLGECDYEDFE